MPTGRNLIAALLAIAIAAPARAADTGGSPPQKLTYDLSMNGQPIGTRTLSIRYLSREDGERRVIEAYTDVTVAGQHLVCRSSGQSSPHGANFTSSVSQDGTLSEVQGVALPGGGWRITQVDASGVHERTLAAAQARLSSLDLLDPGRTPLLAGGGDLALVLAETGEVVTGTLDEGQAGNTKVGGRKVPVTRYTAAGPGGNVRLDVDENGVLLRSELLWLGGVVTAVAREAPPARSYGTVETIESMSPGVSEDPL